MFESKVKWVEAYLEVFNFNFKHSSWEYANSDRTNPQMHQIEKLDANVVPNPRSQIRQVFADMYEIHLSLISFRPFVANVVTLRGRSKSVSTC